MIDSQTWRRLMRSPAGARTSGSRPFRAADSARRYAVTSVQRARSPGRFRDVRTLCTFIGHVKSGGTLLGALLDAHPQALVADEVDVLRYVAAGFHRDQIFHLLEKGSRREARKGRVTARRLDPYSLAVPGGWQGRSHELRVIGESRAGPTTRRLGRDPALLEKLERRMGAVRPLFIHVVRDPLDPISAMVVRGKRTLEEAIADYAGQCRTLVELRGRIAPERLLTVEYETFVRDPIDGLRTTCRFLGLEPDPRYLDTCTAIVDPSSPGERRMIEWSTEQVEAVHQLIAGTAFLDRYRRDGDRRAV